MVATVPSRPVCLSRPKFAAAAAAAAADSAQPGATAAAGPLRLLAGGPAQSAARLSQAGPACPPRFGPGRSPPPPTAG
jgi:hypothetical protein